MFVLIEIFFDLKGTGWELVDDHILHVSVSKHDQVRFRIKNRSEFRKSDYSLLERFGLFWMSVDPQG